MTTCDHCGVTYDVGDWPWCPHGRAALAAHGDDVPGGFWAENGFRFPRKFYSRSEHERALRAEGKAIAAKNAGPDDKICARWDTVDLEAAKILLTRGLSSPRDVAAERERLAQCAREFPVEVRVLAKEDVGLGRRSPEDVGR